VHPVRASDSRESQDRRPRVLIADDHALLAEGLARILGQEYRVIGISADGRRLVSDALQMKPDAVVLDIAMPELNGLEAAAQIRALLPDTRLVFVTQTVDPYYARAAFRSGGIAYVAKQSGRDELLTALRRAMRGRPYLTPLLRDALSHLSLAELQRPGESIADELTPRQREVLQMVAEGRTVKEISTALNISPKTVEFHKKALMNETGLRNTADLTRYAIARGVIASSGVAIVSSPK
jgi:DNA-binding NarL/FixJ family response regulator